MLKRSPRTGYQFLGTGGESVADHSFRMTIVGYVLASMEPEADGNKVVLMCLFHDLPETRTGDHNYVNKRYTQVDEESALEDQVRGLPFGNDMKESVPGIQRGADAGGETGKRCGSDRSDPGPERTA